MNIVNYLNNKKLKSKIWYSKIEIQNNNISFYGRPI